MMSIHVMLLLKEKDFKIHLKLSRCSKSRMNHTVILKSRDWAPFVGFKWPKSIMVWENLAMQNSFLIALQAYIGKKGG